ncbi:DUF924 domain-containing protein [Pelistega sp. NLN82]|uniref:DUF924 domain-containing protein n=1 Tax=Pelistega ratti TaxID=2652177 RepID=A0A6L9Y673_9BURK|nr:DUF924 family protein [Pelistega ratti]NEN75970.1 DUF924 domain-containing protein [Pelistega ratti]
MTTIHSQAQVVLDFWYKEENRAFWFAQSDAFDETIRTQFTETLQQAMKGELYTWRSSIKGRLAEIIVLDQFSRNIFRGQAQAFAQDSMALVLSQTAVELPDYTTLAMNEKQFLLLPYMHSESALIHQEAVKLFQQMGDDYVLDFEYKHKVIIDRFGRYPHRNAILGRTSTPEEEAFLKEPNSSF